jgi:CheY-like chemotaxis protein
LSLCRFQGDALAAAKNADRPVVVAVDDSPDFRRVLSLVLTEAGLDVRTAGSGAEALQMLANLTPDLLILDVSMPGMSGYDLCHVIKREERLANIPVVFLSAYGNPKHYKLGHDAGAVVYIVKPFMPERLVNVVSMLVEAGRRGEKKSGVA